MTVCYIFSWAVSDFFFFIFENLSLFFYLICSFVINFVIFSCIIFVMYLKFSYIIKKTSIFVATVVNLCKDLICSLKMTTFHIICESGFASIHMQV